VRSTLQRSKAEELMEAAGLKHHKDLCGLLELEKIQATIPEYRIKIYTKEKYGGLLYDGKNKNFVPYCNYVSKN